MLACTCRHCHSQHCSEDEGECEGVPVQQVSPRLHSGGRYTAILCHPPATKVRPSLCDTVSTVTVLTLCQQSLDLTLSTVMYCSDTVNCHCSGTLSTVIVLTLWQLSLCLLSLALTVCQSLNLILHCQVSSCYMGY